MATLRLRSLLPLLVAGVATGCDAAVERSAGGGDDLSGAPHRELREVFQLGSLEAAEEEAFQLHPQVIADGKGSTYVLHQNMGRVAVFDDRGAFLHWIGGGRGEGPGEFTSAARMGLVGDTLWVRNFTIPRISRFLPDGTHVATDRALVDAAYATTAGVQGVSGYLRHGRAWMEPDGVVMTTGDGAPRAPFVVGDRSMQRQDTLFTWRAARGSLAGTRFQPLAEPPFHDVASDGSAIVVAEWSDEQPETLVVEWWRPDSRSPRGFRMNVPPSPVASAERDSLVELARARVRGVRERVVAQGIPAEHAPVVPTAAEVREEAYLPDYHPPIRAVRWGLDGTIWMQRTEVGEPGRGEDTWIALSGDGAPLYQVSLPAGSQLHEASRAAVWTSEVDERDIPYVVRWEVVEDRGAQRTVNSFNTPWWAVASEMAR